MLRVGHVLAERKALWDLGPGRIHRRRAGTARSCVWSRPRGRHTLPRCQNRTKCYDAIILVRSRRGTAAQHKDGAHSSPASRCGGAAGSSFKAPTATAGRRSESTFFSQKQMETQTKKNKSVVHRNPHWAHCRACAGGGGGRDEAMECD